MTVKQNFKCRRCGEIFLGYAWEKHDCGYKFKVTKCPYEKGDCMYPRECKDCNGDEE